MKKFLEIGNLYAEHSDWTDFALTKFCLCAMGILLGICVPSKYKVPSFCAAAGIFATTYIPLMGRLFRRIRAAEE